MKAHNQPHWAPGSTGDEQAQEPRWRLDTGFRLPVAMVTPEKAGITRRPQETSDAQMHIMRGRALLETGGSNTAETASVKNLHA